MISFERDPLSATVGLADDPGNLVKSCFPCCEKQFAKGRPRFFSLQSNPGRVAHLAALLKMTFSDQHLTPGFFLIVLFTLGRTMISCCPATA